ncbi:MAG TPA: CARDB domain-containing protein [Vicinamibacterales bacterium]|nr:CARDB domain-containing protein [Vicinamibacterales bacterium]
MTVVTTARQPGAPSAAEREYLVQFRGPIQESWKAAVTAAGATLLDYQPPFAFRARLRPSDIPALNALAFVSAVAPYRTDAKITRARGGSGDQLFVVRVERDHDAAALATVLGGLGLRVSRGGSSMLVIAAPFERLRAIAAIPGVASLEPYTLRVKHNEFGGGVIMGSRVANSNGYDGSTQVIGIADTGIGGGTAATAHPDIQLSRIRALYNRPGAPSSCFDSIVDDGLVDVDSGHGTHVATAALGSGGALGVGRGTAPGAALVFQAIENYAVPSLLCSLLYGISDGYYLVGLPTDLGELYQQAFDDGARIHSDSWGSAVNGAYTADAENTDAFVWTHRDMALLFSAGNEGVDVDGDGQVDAGSVGSPATAKNVIAVGASENDRRGDWHCDQGLTSSTCASQGGQNSIFTYGASWPDRFAANPLRDDASAGNAEQMAAFSSRGPTADGRIKPDVVAPGTWTLSGYSDLYQQQYDAAPNPRTGLYQYDGWGIPADAGHKYMGGTSMAAPLAAGAAAVVRDFYLKARGHQASAALVKATLINTAVDLLDENNDGALDNAFPIPNVHEGWGRVDLQNATDNTQQFSDEIAPLTTGATATYTFNVTEPGLPFKATLVWSDYPASASAATSLVNDLDLRLIAPDGTTYLGNVFAGGWSAFGGAPDRVNNVENAYVASAVPGTWTVVVSAYNVPMGPQTFALVVDNAPSGNGLPTVRVSVDDGSAAEAGLSAGAVRLTRTGDLSDPLTVTYSVGGTASAGTDFVAMPGVATFAAGDANVTVPIVPLDDILVEPDETVVVSLSDGTGYSVGSPSSGTVTIASDDVPPDLMVSSLSAPATAAPGGTISLTDTTRNLSGSPAPASSTGFYLSLNSTIDGSDTYLGSRSVNTLASGGSESGSTTVTIPATIAPGTYYIVARADWAGLLQESNETNNARASNTMRVGPDLVVSALTVPATAAPGSTVLVADTTRNQGAGSAASTSTAFYLSTNTSWDAADVALGTHAVAALAGSASAGASTEVTIPGTTVPGTYYIVARADAGDAVPETLENNNTRAATVRVGADLIVSSVAVPSAAGAGDSITVAESTRNSGGAESVESTTEFYLSGNASLDVNDVRLGARDVPTLAAGATSSTNVTLVIPAGTAAGSYYVIAKADALLEVGETSETNNTRASGVIKVGPDLVVAALSVPASADAGTAISVSDSLQNQGGASSGGTEAVFYLSTNTSLAAGDIELGRRAVPAMGGSGIDAATVSLALPANLAAGSYYVIEMVDAGLVVTESSETNNTRASAAIKVGPDLSVTSLSGPASVIRGGSVTMTDITRNQGGGAAPVSTTRFYLSTNATWDAADVPLGGRAIGVLAAGAQSQASTALVVPAGTAPGTYYVIARCDDAGVVGETAENNNTRSTPLKVNP